MWWFAKGSPAATQDQVVCACWRKPSEFESLALPLFDSLYNFARWLVSNRTDAEDLVQETYLRALRAFQSRPPHTNFKAWMFAILRNTSSRRHPKLLNTTAFESEDELPPTTTNPESLLLDQYGIENLWLAIEALPSVHREVLLLREIEEASYSQIAEILSIPLGTVMSRLSRARSTIREALCKTAVTGRRRGQPLQVDEILIRRRSCQ